MFFCFTRVLSLNLISILKANITLFIEHDVMVLEDGAGRQLIEQVFYRYLSLVFYLLFKACEKNLVERLTGKGSRDDKKDNV